MIISYATHYNWHLLSGKMITVATDNQTVYQDLISGIRVESERILVTDDEYNEINQSKEINWIGDLLNFNATKLLETSVKKISQNLNEQQINALHDTTTKLFTQVQDCLFMTNVPLQVNNDGDLWKIFKYCGITLDHSIQQNPYGIIRALINMQLEIGDKRPIGLTNVAHYLNADQIQDLSSLCKADAISLIMIEFAGLTSQYRYPNCDFYHIDEDFVDWHTD